MLNIISRFLFIFFIFSIAYPSTAMETERDRLQLNKRSNYPNSTYQSETIPRTPRAKGNEELDRTFSPLTRAKFQPTTPGQMLAGLFAAFGVLPAIQVGIPLGMIGLDMLGVTSKILPVGSTESYYVLGAVALPALLAGTIWAYRSTIRVTQYLKPKVVTAKTTTTERPYSWKEHLLFSYVTPSAQTLLGGGLLFAFIYDKESRVSGWVDPRIWQYTMGLPNFLIYYLLITRHTNNPNIHIFWWLLVNKKAEENRQSANIRALVASNIEHIKYFGIVDNIHDLGEVLFIIPEVKQPNPTMYLDYGQGPKYGSESEDDSMVSVKIDQSSEQLTLDDSNTATQNTALMLQYLKVFQKFGEVGKIDPTLNEWNSFARKTSAVESSILKTASLPMMGIMTYFYLNNLFSSLGMPSTWSMGVSTGITIFPGSILLLLIAAKGLPMVDKETNAIMHGCPPEVEGRFWGQRIAPWLARGASILYCTLPVTQFLQHNILRGVNITNPYLQAALITPFAYTVLYPFGIQIFDPPFTMIANWVATGGQVDLSGISTWFAEGGKVDLSTRLLTCTPFKLCPCCAEDDDIYNLEEDDDDLQTTNTITYGESWISKLFFCFKPFKLCFCFGRDEVTEKNLLILDRMLGIQETVQDLNVKYTGILYKELEEIGVSFPQDDLTENKQLIRGRG